MAVALGIKGYAKFTYSATDYFVALTGGSVSAIEGDELVPVFDTSASAHMPIMGAARLGVFSLSGYVYDTTANNALATGFLGTAFLDTGQTGAQFTVTLSDGYKKVSIANCVGTAFSLSAVPQVGRRGGGNTPGLLQVAFSGIGGIYTSWAAADTITPKTEPLLNASRILVQYGATTLEPVAFSIQIGRDPAAIHALGYNVAADGLYDGTYLDKNYIAPAEIAGGFWRAMASMTLEQRITSGRASSLVDLYTAATFNGASNLVVNIKNVAGTTLSIIRLINAIAFGRYDASLQQPRVMYPITVYPSRLDGSTYLPFTVAAS